MTNNKERSGKNVEEDWKQQLKEAEKENIPADQKLAEDILLQLKELTKEVKLFRKQLDEQAREQELYLDKRLKEIQPRQSSSGEEETLEIVDLEQSDEKVNLSEETDHTKEKSKKTLSIVSSVLFYVGIVAFVFCAFLIRSNQKGRPLMIGGYSAMTVLTGSMEKVYPQGSLIITKSIDSDLLKIGDDITYMTGESSSITHRIIGITENYLDTGKRGFETQGVMNEKPDKEIVASANVVGKVVFCSKTMGNVASYITKNWPFLLFAVFIIVGLISFLQWNAKRTDDDTLVERNRRNEKKNNRDTYSKK